MKIIVFRFTLQTTSRVVSRTVKKSQDYNLPHIYVLSLLTENQFPLERNTYLHHAQLVRNRRMFYEKLDKEFAKDESLKGYTDETLLNEIDGMTDILYEKQGSYLQGKADDRKEVAKILIEAGILTPEKAISLLHVNKRDLLSSDK